MQYSIDSMTDICKQMLATTKVHKKETATVQYLIDGIPPATAAAAVVPDAASKAEVHNIETAIVQYSIDGMTDSRRNMHAKTTVHKIETAIVQKCTT